MHRQTDWHCDSMKASTQRAEALKTVFKNIEHSWNLAFYLYDFNSSHFGHNIEIVQSVAWNAKLICNWLAALYGGHQ